MGHWQANHYNYTCQMYGTKVLGHLSFSTYCSQIHSNSLKPPLLDRIFAAIAASNWDNDYIDDAEHNLDT